MVCASGTRLRWYNWRCAPSMRHMRWRHPVQHGDHMPNAWNWLRSSNAKLDCPIARCNAMTPRLITCNESQMHIATGNLKTKQCGKRKKKKNEQQQRKRRLLKQTKKRISRNTKPWASSSNRPEQLTKQWTQQMQGQRARATWPLFPCCCCSLRALRLPSLMLLCCCCWLLLLLLLSHSLYLSLSAATAAAAAICCCSSRWCRTAFVSARCVVLICFCDGVILFVGHTETCLAPPPPPQQRNVWVLLFFMKIVWFGGAAVLYVSAPMSVCGVGWDCAWRWWIRNASNGLVGLARPCWLCKVGVRRSWSFSFLVSGVGQSVRLLVWTMFACFLFTDSIWL